MAKAANSSHPSERKTPLFQVVKVAFIALFVALVFLLGLSMVHHRFFRGGRVHHNGSVGQ